MKDDLLGDDSYPPSARGAVPLAEQLRPKRLEDLAGQAHLKDPDGLLMRMMRGGPMASLILWGPPGCGKTTLARIVAANLQAEIHTLSAVHSGAADIRRILESARARHARGGVTVLFVDEIHRFNRAQQDSFLAALEDGTLVLIGATTENPSFALNAALLSRAQVMILHPLDADDLDRVLQRCETLIGRPLPLTPEARALLIAFADGDARALVGLCESCLDADVLLDRPAIERRIQKRAPLFDTGGDHHYNLVSVLHKAVRGSDVDAALYWLARMLGAGEDPRFIARRLVRMAVEDIGLAEPDALPRALAAWEAFERLGLPEGELALAQCVIDLATAPKSNAVYRAWKAAQDAAARSGSVMPPLFALNAPTALMRETGYGAGYRYDHDEPHAFAGQNYFPASVVRQIFYEPVPRGHERTIMRRLEFWNRHRSS